MGKIIRYFKNAIHNLATLSLAIFKDRLSAESMVVKEDQCEIGSNVSVRQPSRLYQVSIGRGTYISRNANISYTQIGNFCSIGPNLLCGWGVHPINGISTSPVFYSKTTPFGFSYSSSNKFDERQDIRIGNDVFIGGNVTILDGVTIGDGAVIGAGAVVSKDIPPYAVAIGCPIRILKYRFTEKQIHELLSLKWWNRDEDILKLVEEKFDDVDSFIDLCRIKDSFS